MAKQYKLIGWYVVCALLAWCMWGASRSLGFDAVTGIKVGGPALGLFLLLITLTVIGYAIFRLRWVALVSSGIIGLSFLAWYGFSKLNWLGVLILVLLAYESYRRAGTQIQRTKISLAEILSHGLYPIVIGLFILASFAAYRSPLASQLESSKRLPSQTQAFFQQVSSKVIGPQLDTNSASERQYIEGQVATQAYQQANNFLKPYFKYAPPLLAFGLFIILWGLSWIFVWLAVLIGMLVFWILKKTRFVQVEEKDVKAEVIVI